MAGGSRPRIRLLGRDDCPLCDRAEALLEALKAEYAFELVLVDVDEETDLRLEYGDRVPVALHGGEELFDLEAGPEAIREAVDAVATPRSER